MVAKNTSWVVDEFYLDTRVHLHLLNFLFLSFPDLFLSSWIYKSSSLPFLSRFDADNTQFRPSLLLRDVNKQPECNVGSISAVFSSPVFDLNSGWFLSLSVMVNLNFSH